eukprot:g33755.t1
MTAAIGGATKVGDVQEARADGARIKESVGPEEYIKTPTTTFTTACHTPHPWFPTHVVDRAINRIRPITHASALASSHHSQQ